MTARDINIGDYILIDGKLNTINRIDTNTLGVKGGLVYRLDNKSVQQIPLNDEWLPKMGFHRHHQLDYLYFREFPNKQVLCIDTKEHKVILLNNDKNTVTEEISGICYYFNDVEQYYYKLTKNNLHEI